MKERIKGLMATAASRAWLGVTVVGLITVVLVLVLSLIPRLTAGQHVIDTAEPAFTDERVAGTRVGVDLLSQYVDFLDPVLTSRGGANKEVRSLVRLIRRELGLSDEQARKILRREAPHAEALMRALPLTGLVDEIPRLTSYLTTTLRISEDELAAILEREFPRIAQMLTTLPIVTDSWYDVPGIEGLTRLSGGKPVRTVPGLRKYVRDDVVPLTVQRKDDFQSLAGRGGIGYIPYLLLLVGLAMIVYGLLQARRATITAPGRLSWSIVIGSGALLIVFVGAASLFPRLAGGQRLVDDMAPVFAQERVQAVTTGFDTVHEIVVLGDPIMTRGGGASRETPRLYELIGQRTGRRPGDVRRTLARRVPRTIALLDALPLTSVAREVPRLVAYLAKALRMSRDNVVSLLRRRTPRLTRALLATPPVTSGWTSIPRTGELTQFDGVRPVRTMPALDDYLRQDLLPVFEKGREDLETFASGSPQIKTLAPALAVYGLVVVIYGALMMLLVGRRKRR
ncbi:MAG TPA: hypothetical protein VNA28_17430 [Solirubrobacteraceae bacterium]|nr:hypothetical protein [Solirubrobacteraceae bacterium]